MQMEKSIENFFPSLPCLYQIYHRQLTPMFFTMSWKKKCMIYGVKFFNVLDKSFQLQQTFLILVVILFYSLNSIILINLCLPLILIYYLLLLFFNSQLYFNMQNYLKKSQQTT